MKQNPIATIIFSNGGKVQMELYPDIAPNAVASFIYLAKQGVYDHYPIERIVPGWVLDMSYHAFHNPKACYFIPNDVKSGKYLEAVPGTIGLGGYGAPEIAGGEFSFRLQTVLRLPVFILFLERLQMGWNRSDGWNNWRPILCHIRMPRMLRLTHRFDRYL